MPVWNHEWMSVCRQLYLNPIVASLLVYSTILILPFAIGIRSCCSSEDWPISFGKTHIWRNGLVLIYHAYDQRGWWKLWVMSSMPERLCAEKKIGNVADFYSNRIIKYHSYEYTRPLSIIPDRRIYHFSSWKYQKLIWASLTASWADTAIVTTFLDGWIKHCKLLLTQIKWYE